MYVIIVDVGDIMRFKVFSSGSDGNCTLIEIKNTRILVDVGITKKKIIEGLESMNLCLNDINGILITHEHVDHIKALPTLLKECYIPIYLSLGTLNNIYNMYKARGQEKILKMMDDRYNESSIIPLKKIENSLFYESINIGGNIIDILPMFHDAIEPIGFQFHEGEKRLVYITDTGYVHEELFKYINDADAYILESNHDPEILLASNRPYNLKMRIISDHGHLSNEKSMVLLAKLMGENTKVVLHAHVSQECNLSEIIIMTREKVFDSFGIDYSNVEFEILHPYFSKEYTI